MLAEDAHSLLRGSFEAMKWHILVDNLLHPLPNILDIRFGQRLGILLLEIAVIAIRNRVLDEEFTAGKDIADSLVENKTEGAHIHTPP